MSFFDYFKEKLVFILINIIVLIISAFILIGLRVDNYAIIFIFMIILLKVGIIKGY